MRNNIYRSICKVLLVFILASCSALESEESLRILFIGNSYTYYNSSPELLKEMVKERFPGRQIETKLISQGGYTLARHWQDSSTLETIKTGDWDYVVLQEQSRLGMGITIDEASYFGNTDSFYKHVRLFDSEIKRVGAKTVLLMTWSRRGRQKEQGILTHAYTRIAKELHAILAPVGMVWDNVRENDQLSLYDNDGSHPFAQGSFLLASTLFAKLFNESPEGLSGEISGFRLSSSGQSDSTRQILTNLTSNQALVIQKACWEVVNQLNETGPYPNVSQPTPTYSIPVLETGREFIINDIRGTWYGTSSYGFNYLGHVMTIEEESDDWQIKLAFYSPHKVDRLEIKDVNTSNNQWDIEAFDPLRNRNITLSLAMDSDDLRGLLSSIGGLSIYKNMVFSRSPNINEVDLSKHVELINTFERDSEKDDFVEAAVSHYKKYGKLIGREYQPEEFYLNSEGYNLLRENKSKEALGHFELALHYYPSSVNVYSSYAEGLLAAGRRKEALDVYAKAYELAKETSYQNLEYIEENYNRLKDDLSPRISEGEMPPPPPPPPSEENQQEP